MTCADKEAQDKLGKIGLIAGNGNFPWLLVSNMLVNETPFAVAGLSGFAETGVKEAAGNCYIEAYVSDFAKIARFFKKERVKTVVIIGGVNKKAARINNFFALKALFKLLFYKKKNDGIFRIIISEFENKGFKVVGAQDAMPSLTTLPGLLTQTKPSEQNMKDIKYAVSKCRDFGKTDIGQSIVVKNGRIIGKESSRGTDGLMAESRAANGSEGGSGGIMAKLAKEGQEERADIPAIGFETVRQMIGAKIEGIVIDAGRKSIIEEKNELVRFADANGVFILAI